MTTAVATAQASLFDTDERLPPGLDFRSDFIDTAEERALLEAIAALPLRQATYKAYTARRRVFAFDGSWPAPVRSLQLRMAEWAGIDASEFTQAMVSEYTPGTPLGWHRDAPHYELIVGVSLLSSARLRFRPWPHERDDDKQPAKAPPPSKADIIALDLAPRSAYLMRGPARWGWQHSVPPVAALRYSITMRTARNAK